MNWNKLQNEQCPKYDCGATLEYHNNIEQYTCTKCSFSIYARNFERLTVGIKNNKLTKEPMKYLAKETPTKSYYEAKHGEPMSNYQKVTG